MSYQTTLKNTNHDVPEDKLSIILAHNRTAASITVAHTNKKGEKGLVVARQPQRVDAIADIQKMLGNYKSQQLLLGFSNSGGLTENDLQPFVILSNSEGKPIMIAHLDGDFSEWKKPSAELDPMNSAEYCCVRDYIIPHMQKLYADVDHDITKLSAKIVEPTNSRYFGSAMDGDRGTITFMDLTGAVSMCTIKGDATQEAFDWGWMSNTYQEGIAEIAAEEPEDDLAAQLEAGLGGSAAPAKVMVPQAQTNKNRIQRPGQGAAVPIASTQPIKPAVQPSPAPDTQPAPKEDGQPTVVAARLTDKFYLDVPHNITMKERSKWFRGRNKEKILPPGWESAKQMVVTASQATEKFVGDWCRAHPGFSVLGTILNQEQPAKPKPEAQPDAAPVKPVEQPVAAPKNKIARPGAPAAAAEVTVKKDTATDHVASSRPPNVTMEPLAVIPPTAKAKILEIIESQGFKDAVAKDLRSMNDPGNLHLVEQQIDNFAKQCGLKSIWDTYNWPLENLLALFNATGVGTNSAVYLCASWRAAAMKTKAELAAANEMLDQMTQPDAKAHGVQKNKIARPAA